MHEMSICESLLQIIEQTAHEQSFERVKSVYLSIGPFAGIETEAMKFCFDVVCQHSIAKGAHLVINEIPGKAWCMACATPLEVMERTSPCPKCGSYQLQFSGGDEMKITELEVA